MEKMRPNRQLAAIMFTDIVGYTALMGSDEDKAFEVLRKNQDIHNKLIGQFNGTLIKEMGDGMLISFPLASEAVRCAIEIQKTCKEQDIPLKIGIHEGEMVFAGSDVLGDGVNIASRLQEEAEEGCIVISGKVYSDIKNKAGIYAKFIGDKKLKNVEDLVKVYEVSGEGEEQETKVKTPKKFNSKNLYYILIGIVIVIAALLVWNYLPVSTHSDSIEVKKSIAVLPFKSLSEDPEKQYLADGVVDAIVLHLSKIEDLRVITRTSVEKYRNPTQTIPEIAGELQVNYILEGRFQKYGDQVRLSVQLSNVEEKEGHLWAKEYNRDWSDIFAVQSEVAETIATELNAEITQEELAFIKTRPTQNAEAYALYLEGESTWNLKLLNQAIALDSNYADAYALKALYWLAIAGGFGGSKGSQLVISNALPLLTKALEIDPDHSLAHTAYGSLQMWYFWNFEEAEREYLIAISSDPTHFWININYNDFLRATGRFQEALDWVVHAVDQGYITEDSHYVVLSQYYAGRLEDVQRTMDTYLADNKPDQYKSSITVSGVFDQYLQPLLYLGRYEDLVRDFQRIQTFYGIGMEGIIPRSFGCAAIAYSKLGQADKTQEILDILQEKANNSAAGSPSYYTAMFYAAMGEIDLAFEWLEKGYNKHEIEMYWLKVEPPFEPIRSDPRYQVMLEKIGYPD